MKYLYNLHWIDETEIIDDYIHLSKKGFINIDVDDTEIVFIDDTGDFLHIPINIYALKGALLLNHQINISEFNMEVKLS